MRARLNAFLWHLACTAAALAAVLAVVLLCWYPFPYREIMGVGRNALLLVALTIGLGPVLTLVVFRPGKKGLKFDLVAIALLQAAAFSYGTYQLYVRHPVYVVFAVDRFTMVLPGEIDPAAVQGGPFAHGVLSRPLTLVATLPSNQRELEQLLEETLYQGKPDIDHRPRYWSPYARSYRSALEAARPLAELRRKRPEAVALIDRFVNASERPLDALDYLPLIVVGSDWVMLLDTEDGAILGALEIDAWLE